MARILAISNQKGGVGKTTTAVNLAAALAHACAQRVLLVDLDPQGNASSGLGHPRPDVEAGVYDALLRGVPVDSLVRKTSVEGLSLLPATRDLVGAEVELVDEPERESVLRRTLEPLADQFDWIVIDCAPSLGLLTVNALVAANGVLIPLQAEYYAMEGLSDLLYSMQLVRKRLNRELTREGVLLTMSDRRNRLAREVEEQAREAFGPEVFTTVIPRNVRLGEAPSYGRSIVEHDPRSKGAMAYTRLAFEVIGRRDGALRMRRAG